MMSNSNSYLKNKTQNISRMKNRTVLLSRNHQPLLLELKPFVFNTHYDSGSGLSQIFQCILSYITTLQFYTNKMVMLFIVNSTTPAINQALKFKA